MEDNSCPKSSSDSHHCSESFEVKAIQNSARHLNPHFTHGLSPSYALPTIASQIRLSLTIESFSRDSVPVCNRYKTPSCRHQGKPLSGSPTDALETKFTSRKPDSAPAGNKSSTGTFGSTPVQTLCIKNCNKGHSGSSRPSSAKTCSYVSGPTKKNLFGKERNSSSHNSSLSQRLKEDIMAANPSTGSTLADENEVSSSADNHSKKGTDRPRSVDTREGFPSDSSSVKSNKSFAKTNDVSSSEKSSKSKELASHLWQKKDDKKVLIEKSKHLHGNENTNLPAVSGAQPSGSSVLDEAVSNSVHNKVASKVDKVKSFERKFLGLPLKPEHKLNSKKEFSKEFNEKHADLLRSKPNSESDDAKETSSLKAPNLHDKNAISNNGKMKQASSGKPAAVTKRPKSEQHNKDSPKERESTKLPALNNEVESVDHNGCKKEPAQHSSHQKPNQKSSQMKTSMLQHEKEAKHSEDVTALNPSNEKDVVVDEYRAKLAEKRKLARAKAEHEAEEERLKQEEMRIAEMERKRREEEEERKRDEEELRLAEESRQLEEERYRKSVEETELRRRLEAEQAEAEAKAKLEQQRLAREEAEKIEKERLEKQKREDEEKINRKKRLEEIMKRVKVDEPEVESKTRDHQLPADDATVEPFESVIQQVSELETVVCPNAVTQVGPAGESMTRFKSPLLQQILTGKSKVPDVVKNIFNVEAKDVNGTAKEVKETSKVIALAAQETDLLTEETNGAGEEVTSPAESDAGTAVETFGRAKETKNHLSEDLKTISEQSQLILQP